MKYSPGRSHVPFNRRLCSVPAMVGRDCTRDPNLDERSQFSPNDSDKAVIMDNFRETRYVGYSSKNLAIGNEPKMIIRKRFIPHYEESAIFGYFISMRIEILELAGRRYSEIINIGIFKFGGNLNLTNRYLQYVGQFGNCKRCKSKIYNCDKIIMEIKISIKLFPMHIFVYIKFVINIE